MRNEGQLAFEHIAKLICPDCYGKLLRGQRGGSINQNLTCGVCEMKFNATVVSKITLAPMFALPQSDTEFRDRAEIIAFERLGSDPAGAAYYNPALSKQQCLYEPCRETFTGPALYCCLCCAISDA